LCVKEITKGRGEGGDDDDDDDMNGAQVGFVCVRRSVDPRKAQLHTPDVFTSSYDY